ncbi:MAG: hypothetical protein QXX07_00555 [Candidatus Aenigmatarchaeota archaeon]
MEERRKMNYIGVFDRLNDAKTNIHSFYQELREQTLAVSRGIISREESKMEEKGKVEMILKSFEEFCYTCEEVLSMLKEDAKKIEEERIPEELKKVLQNYANALKDCRNYMEIVFKDPLFEFYSSKDTIYSLKSRLSSLEKGTKKLLYELSKKNSSVLLLK